MLIGIDLLWVRPKICGGTESVIRNLIQGFGMYDEKNEYILFVGKDTADTFTEYSEYPNVRIQVCNTESLNRIKRIAWENKNLDKMARSMHADMMFVPVYSKPNSKPVSKGGIPYVTVIYDLQALHFPEYFSRMKLIFAKRSWKKACDESAKVITASRYCKDDIAEHYPFVKDRIEVIYVPLIVDNEMTPEDKKDIFDNLSGKYHISENGYFYTVSSMMPHKNLDTLLKLMKEYKDGDEFPDIKLVVSGVGGNKDDFINKVKEYGIEDRVVDTGYVSDCERDVLYEKCRLFLFPSEFEGFGMPPVEAMLKGANVVCTKEACIEEITDNRAEYVASSRDTDEWKRAVAKAMERQKKAESFPQYELSKITREYTDLFEGIMTQK